MIILLQGDDQFLLQKNRQELINIYKGDDYNYVELRDIIELPDLTSAMQQVPMLVDNYTVYLVLNKKQFIRVKDYIKPSIYTVVILQLEDFFMTEDLRGSLQISQVLDCRSPRGKELTNWVMQRAKTYGFVLDNEDKKFITMMYSSLKDIDDILFQMSFLEAFDRQTYLRNLFNIKEKFVWDLFMELINGRKSDFFSKFAEQSVQNLELGVSQFNMKVVGGLLYCITNWDRCPEWVLEKTKDKYDRSEIFVPFIFCELMKILLVSKRETSSIPILSDFNDLLVRVTKI